MMEASSALQHYRQRYQPKLPPLLNEIKSLVLRKRKEIKNSEMKEIFPHTYELPLLSFISGEVESVITPLKVGVVLSGGQASGGAKCDCRII